MKKMRFIKWIIIVCLLCGLIKMETVNSYASSNVKLEIPKIESVDASKQNRVTISWKRIK